MKFLAICKNTFVQTIRQPIFLVILVATFGVLVLTVPLAGWTMGSDYHKTDQQFLVNMGLSTLLLSGLWLAAFSASSAVGREIEDRTALTVIAKPVSRPTFLLGKFAGVSLAVTLGYYLATLVFLLTVRHRVMPAAWDQYDWPVIVLGCGAVVGGVLIGLGGNYLFNWTFTSTWTLSTTALMTVAMAVVTVIGKGWEPIEFGQGVDAMIVLGAVMMFLAVIVFAAVATAASTRLGQIPTLLLCLALLLVGSMHPYLFGSDLAEQVPLIAAAGWLVPNLTFFYPLHILTAEKSVPAGYVTMMIGYCALCVAAALAIGVGLFHTRQLQAESRSIGIPGPVGLLSWLGRAGSLAAVAIGAAILTVPSWYGVESLIAAAGLILGGLAGWLVWGFFARGARWAMGVVAAVAGIELIRAVLAVAGVSVIAPEGVELAVAQGLAAATVILLLLLRQTRRHFQTQGRSSLPAIDQIGPTTA